MSDSDHPQVQTIKRYYQGCNSADVDLMMSTFTADIVHYFVDHAPVASASGLANFWAKVGPLTQAVWSVDQALVEGEKAAIEWSMSWVPVGNSKREWLRGSEWFNFRAGRIAEIRSYHNNPHLHDARNCALWDFPYQERGYPN